MRLGPPVLLFAVALAAPAADLKITELRVSAEPRGQQQSDEIVKFRPGQRVYVIFRIEGFAKSGEHSVYLEYTLQPFDSAGVPFEPATSGRLLRRIFRDVTAPMVFGFIVPPAPRAGPAKFNISVSDQVAQAAVTAEAPFEIESELPAVTEELAVLDFAFVRSQMDLTPLANPFFKPGDTIWSRFYLSGFKTAENNRYKLSYGVALRSADGRTVLQEPQAVSESRESYYPKLLIPALISLRLDYRAPLGDYRIVINVRDENSDRQTTAEFPLRVR